MIGGGELTGCIESDRPQCRSHRRRMETEAKAKVAASVRGTFSSVFISVAEPEPVELISTSISIVLLS